MTADAPAPQTPDAPPAAAASAPRELPPQPIAARAGRYYRNTRYLLTLMFLVMGAWFAYDGYVAWPAQNVERQQLRDERDAAEKAGDTARVTELSTRIMELGDFKDALGIRIQKILGWTLPPAGLAFLAWALYNSRGTIALRDDVLHVPGHPPVPLDRVTALDRSLWDRKGIAYADYDVDGRTGKLRLDDFVYERKPIDAIYDHLSARLAGSGAFPVTTTGS